MKAVQLQKNQMSIETEGKIFFQSYDTVVCTIENFENGNEPVIKITEGQPQSKTTAKYLNEFLRMHTSFDNYEQIKS
jgi:hypothetical protein